VSPATAHRTTSISCTGCPYSWQCFGNEEMAMNFFLGILLIFAQQAWKPADPAIFCKEAKDKKLCAALLAIRDRDQEVRHRWIADPKSETLKAEVTRVDEENLARIEEIIAKYGWP